MYTVEAVFSFDNIEPQNAVNPWTFAASLQVAEEMYFSFITAPEGKVLGRILTSMTVRDMSGEIRHRWEVGCMTGVGRATFFNGVERTLPGPIWDREIMREMCRVLGYPSQEEK
jgi:hypothetical protein